MPTYTYRCSNCGNFEEQQSIKEPALEFCPICGNSVKRVITGGTGFVMKGRSSSSHHCDRETPCCGREVRCEKSPYTKSH